MLVVAEHGMITVNTRCGYVPLIVTTQQRIMKEDDHRDQQKKCWFCSLPEHMVTHMQ